MLKETVIKYLPYNSALSNTLKYGTEKHPTKLPDEYNPIDYTPSGKYSVYAEGLTTDELYQDVFPLVNPSDLDKRGWSPEVNGMYKKWKSGQFSEKVDNIMSLL